VLRASLSQTIGCLYLSLLSLPLQVHNLKIVGDRETLELSCSNFLHFKDGRGRLCWDFIGYDVLRQRLLFKQIRLLGIFVEYADNMIVVVWQLRYFWSMLLH
jgi:hypothetical protein